MLNTIIVCQVRKRIYKGIPDSLRGRVWSLLLGIDRTKLEQVGVYEVSICHSFGLNFLIFSDHCRIYKIVDYVADYWKTLVIHSRVEINSKQYTGSGI